MGDFVNQMVPIPMETVPPRPQRFSSSTGLRGLGTQGSAFESAHRALQRQQCLFYTSCCASPRGIKCGRPARAAEGPRLCLATHFAGQEPRRRGGGGGVGHFCLVRRPTRLLAPNCFSPSLSTFSSAPFLRKRSLRRSAAPIQSSA